MRRVSTFSERSSPLEFNMTPMIDVVFQLIIFFLWTSSFQIAEQLLPGAVEMPQGSAAADPRIPPPPEEDFDEIIVRIIGGPTKLAWQVNEVPMESLSMLKGYLRQLAEIQTEAPVIVHPDSDVPLGDVIDVYDVSRLAGFNVAFAAPIDAERGNAP